MPFDKGRFRRSSGFTLIELAVVVVIVGILTVFAIRSYLGTVEEGKANSAKSLVVQIGGANRLYFLETGAYVTGAIRAGSPLIARRHLMARAWSDEPYDFSGADRATGPCILARATRKTSGRRGISISPFNGWGFCFDVNGKVLAKNEAAACGSTC